MEKISTHITYEEATSTSTGVDNTPSANQIVVMKNTAKEIFEKPRKGLGDKPIGINSFFRSANVNKEIGGAYKIIDGKYVATSQHCKGMAIDMRGIHCTNAELFFFILEKCNFDQLIWEKGDKDNPAWVHASCKLNKKKNRKQVLIYDGKSYVVYEKGMVNKPKKKPAAKPAAKKTTTAKPAAKKPAAPKKK